MPILSLLTISYFRIRSMHNFEKSTLSYIADTLPSIDLNSQVLFPLFPLLASSPPWVVSPSLVVISPQRDTVLISALQNCMRIFLATSANEIGVGAAAICCFSSGRKKTFQYIFPNLNERYFAFTHLLHMSLSYARSLDSLCSLSRLEVVYTDFLPNFYRPNQKLLPHESNCLELLSLFKDRIIFIPAPKDPPSSLSTALELSCKIDNFVWNENRMLRNLLLELKNQTRNLWNSEWCSATSGSTTGSFFRFYFIPLLPNLSRQGRKFYKF